MQLVFTIFQKVQLQVFVLVEIYFNPHLGGFTAYLKDIAAKFTFSSSQLYKSNIKHLKTWLKFMYPLPYIISYWLPVTLDNTKYNQSYHELTREPLEITGVSRVWNESEGMERK